MMSINGILFVIYLYTSFINVNGNENESEIDALKFDKIKLPKKYANNAGLHSLLCNVCGLVTTKVNDTLYSDQIEYESLVGFRLDSKGNKIRKEGQWLKIFLRLEDLCDSAFKDKFRVGKRDNGYLYLISSEDVKDIETMENSRAKKLDDEQKSRLKDSMLLDLKLLRDKYIENNITLPLLNDTDNETIVNPKHEISKDGKYRQKKYYFKEVKPKLLKKKSKPDKSVMDICYFITEKFDEWLHFKQKIIKKEKTQKQDDTSNNDDSNDETSDDDKKLYNKLNVGPFCVVGFEQLCDIKMFNSTIEYFEKRKKKTAKIPVIKVEELYPELLRNDTNIDNETEIESTNDAQNTSINNDINSDDNKPEL